MSAREDLELAIGDQVAVLDKLTESECAELLAMLEIARRDERQALDESIDGVLAALPWPLRRPAKKIMFGDL
ncbi:hypothetical protein FOS14_01580 [Skermania sp. ID1734]|uniref:hypothetical protein n=1 Tax=Skermania sp. ID1734 TaxID=2597516 RepID=UPI00117E2535|nr:hypothetical protein [Skermania sp. ID1734]TSE02099.1 hypothetical protein FOS14_01580 [Skermania sp. ID1734]